MMETILGILITLVHTFGIASVYYFTFMFWTSIMIYLNKDKYTVNADFNVRKDD